MQSQHLPNVITQIIATIDEEITQQLSVILHHPRLQQLEASWRGIAYLTKQIALSSDKRVKIKLLTISWQALRKDVLRAVEFDQSQLFSKIYNDEFGHPGGEPYGLLVGDYHVSHRLTPSKQIADIQVLEQIAKIAAAAFAPFVTAASPTMFGLDKFAELDRPVDLMGTFQQAEYQSWKVLRQREDARFLGLLLPRVLLRLPYRYQLATQFPFSFSEQLQTQSDYLWGNPGYCFAAVVARAFTQSGWFVEIHGVRRDSLAGGVVTDLPRHIFETDNLSPNYAAEVCITDSQEKQLSDWGFIALCEGKHSQLAAFYSCQSIQQSKYYERQQPTENARLSSMLHYILCVSRFTHYLKVIARNKIGTFANPLDCEQFLQKWLQQYTAASSDLTIDLKAKYPLREAKVKVYDQPGKPGGYLCKIYLSPHLQFDQAETYLQLVTELARN